MEFNGVTLLSSILNYGVRIPGYDTEAWDIFPAMRPLPGTIRRCRTPAPWPDWVEQARKFAARSVRRGAAPGRPPARGGVRRDGRAASPRFTGLSVQYVKESNLRISPTRFRKELLRDDDQILGRYDARFEGFDVDAAGENPGYDPSDTGIAGVFVGAFHDYIQTRAEVQSSEPYYLQGPGINQNWDWHHRLWGRRFGGGAAGCSPTRPSTSPTPCARTRT